MSYANRLIASKAQYIHKFTYDTPQGARMFCYLLVKKERQKDFMRILREKQPLQLAEYGQVLGECPGNSPSEALIVQMIQEYGFERAALA